MAKAPSGKKPAPTQAPETITPGDPFGLPGVPASTLRAEIRAAAAAGHHFYVYTLADADGVFYVGKGKGGRVFQHEKLPRGDRNGVKAARIRASGSPEKTVVAYFSCESAAYALERQMIAAAREYLTNISGGTVTAMESAKAKAKALLEGLIPFDAWEKRVTPEAARVCVSLAGSLQGFYESMKNAIRSEAENPTPTSIFVPHPETCLLGVPRG